MKRSCKDCEYWQRAGDEHEARGICRQMGPQAPHPESGSGLAVWVLTLETSWCAEYESRLPDDASALDRLCSVLEVDPDLVREAIFEIVSELEEDPA